MVKLLRKREEGAVSTRKNKERKIERLIEKKMRHDRITYDWIEGSDET